MDSLLEKDTQVYFDGMIFANCIFSGCTDGPGHTVQMHSSPRSPLSGIPVRTAPAAAVSPIQVYTETFPFKYLKHFPYVNLFQILDMMRSLFCFTFL